MKYNLENKIINYKNQLYVTYTTKQKRTNIKGEQENLQPTESIYSLTYDENKIEPTVNLDLGDTLIFILNNYHELIEEFKNLVLENKTLLLNIQNEQIQISNRGFCEYEKFLDNIIEKFEFLNKFNIYLLIYYIETFMLKTYSRNYYSTLYSIESVLDEKNILLNELLSKFNLSSKEQLQELYKTLQSTENIVNIWTSALLNLENYISVLENTVNLAFAPSYDNSKTNIFTGIDIQLPRPHINYAIKDYRFPKPIQFTYQIENIKDLFYTAIYHLSMENKVIRKCKGCNKYFIPSRTNQTYCSQEYYNNYYGDNVPCKENANSSNKSKDFYRTLKKRFFKKIQKDVYNTRYEEERKEFEQNYDYETKRKEYIELYNGDMEKVEYALLKLYTGLDRKSQKKENKTRPCSTEYYWVD